MTAPLQTDRRPRRFLDPDFKQQVADSVRLEGGAVEWNPEWETAPYEEVFFVNGKELPPMSVYEMSKLLRP